MDLTFKCLLKFFNRSSGQKHEAPPDQKSYQRSFNRFSIEFEVIASVIDSDEHQDSERSELHDVSGGGAMFISRLPERYYPGQLLKLDIFLAGTEDVRACIKTEASVVRIHQIELNDLEEADTKTGIAVKFHTPFEFERIDNSFFR
ncbi:MAG: PilZ domain-containing protein [Desulfobacteraceae bacterium]|nr:PilZ domain-containing protein [Desulfobacteraceae bacterium]MBC2756671.1 PilZ domain-containing protein [Desulfobacteraceae bacterium]